MAIAWRLVNRGSEGWGRQLLEFSWRLQELGSGNRSLDSAGSSLDLVDRPLGKDCCLDSSWGLHRRPRVCQEGKIGLAWDV